MNKRCGYNERIALLGLIGMMLAGYVFGQDRTVQFETEDAGEVKSIPTWGLDTAWLSEVNVRRGVVFMGKPQVDVIRLSFTPDRPLVGGDLTANALVEFNERMSIVNTYTDSHTTLYLNNDADGYHTDNPSHPDYNPSGIDSYYKDGSNQTIATNWANLIYATRQHCEAAGRTVVAVEPFNEPDWDYIWLPASEYQGSPAKLGEICLFISTNTAYGAFTNIDLCGPSTLSCGKQSQWYDPLTSVLDQGCTHQLAGTFAEYAAFYESVEANGHVGVNDELHNVMEAMVGAEYGMDVGIWWGPAERTRGEFVNASDGVRLGYAEHRPNWTAASVYRAPDGAVKAFVGESERQALPTTYRFFSKDRPVFYDGHGPQRAYNVTTTGGSGYQTAAHKNAEAVVNITWGDDVQPVIDGRYIVVNRNSHKVMEVALGDSADGANIRQNPYGGLSYQKWDIYPMPAASGGDYSYFSITAVHSGKAADVYNFDLTNNGDVRQWGLAGTYPGVNQQWYFEYVEDGWFYIRSRWSGKYLEVANASTVNTANIKQNSLSTGGSEHQQWRLIPVGAAVEFNAPAKPTGLTAEANAVSVDLSWNANVEDDLDGYTVLRSSTAGGPYDIIARGVTGTSYTDNSANLPIPYYYVIRASDKSLNTSTNSDEVAATPSNNPDFILHYAFDGDLNDSSGNDNHAAANSTPLFDTGKYGSGSLAFNGSDRYAIVPAEIMEGINDFTIAAWVYWNGGGAWQRIFDFGNDTTEYMFLTPSSAGGMLRFAVTTNGYLNEQAVETVPLPTGSWQHVAVTREGNTVRLYKNGVLADSATIPIAPADFKPVLNYLGESQWENDPLFNGRLDEVYIYNFAFTDSEIAGLMNNQQPPAPSSAPTGLVAEGGDSQIFLSWDPVPEITEYTIRMGLVSGGPYFLVLGHTGSTNFVHDGVPNGTDRYYVVSASNVGGAGPDSEEAHGIASVDVSPAEFFIADPVIEGGTNLSMTVSNTVYGHQYYIQATDTLTPPAWSNIMIEAGTDSDLLFGIPIDPASTNRYFKLDVQRQ